MGHELVGIHESATRIRFGGDKLTLRNNSTTASSGSFRFACNAHALMVLSSGHPATLKLKPWLRLRKQTHDTLVAPIQRPASHSTIHSNVCMETRQGEGTVLSICMPQTILETRGGKLEKILAMVLE
jgi:hypothetical protein